MNRSLLRLIMACCLTGGLLPVSAGKMDARQRSGVQNQKFTQKKLVIIPAAPRRRAFMSVYGMTRPPSGYTGFCHRNPKECVPHTDSTQATHHSRIRITTARWRELEVINRYVNVLIEPATDKKLYGTTEFWTFPKHLRGDCEDYVLLKRRLLMRRGWPESVLLITLVRDENGEGHAILTIRTTKGDYVLDNKTSRIRAWSQTPYEYIKRQSFLNPGHWVSLVPAGGSAQPLAATRGKERVRGK